MCRIYLAKERYVVSDMKDIQQILESLKLYLQYLQQDSTCNPKVARHVQEKIRQIEQS